MKEGSEQRTTRAEGPCRSLHKSGRLAFLVQHIVDLHHVYKLVMTTYMLYKVRARTEHFIAHNIECFL